MILEAAAEVFAPLRSVRNQSFAAAQCWLCWNQPSQCAL